MKQVKFMFISFKKWWTETSDEFIPSLKFILSKKGSDWNEPVRSFFLQKTHHSPLNNSFNPISIIHQYPTKNSNQSN